MKDLHSSPTHFYRYDTIRFLLIFLVLIGHCLEYCDGEPARNLYLVIYSFHMPAFIYITGRMARFNKIRIFKRLIMPYLVFQTLYILYNRWIFAEQARIQYTMPYWIMWYLLTIITYYILIPMLPEKKSKWVLPVLILSLVVSLAVGYMEDVGYYLSLSRTICFSPFFILGYYFDDLAGKLMKSLPLKIGICVICIAVIMSGEHYFLGRDFSIGALQGAYSYVASSSTVADRGLMLLTAACWVLLLESLIPDRRIPIVSIIGQNTMPIYLLHGFVIRYAYKTRLFHYSLTVNLFLAFAVTIILMLVLGNRYMGRFFRLLF